MTNRSHHPATIESLTPQFLLYARAELHFVPETITKYQDCLRQVVRRIGDRTVTELGKPDLLELKASFLASNLSVARQVTVLLALKRFLRYTKEELDLPVMSPDLITIPRRRRAEVSYLKAEEVERFVSSIKIENRDRSIFLRGLRFRVEVLLGSAMRW